MTTIARQIKQTWELPWGLERTIAPDVSSLSGKHIADHKASTRCVSQFDPHATLNGARANQFPKLLAVRLFARLAEDAPFARLPDLAAAAVEGR
jgi:hypothetical protein